MLRADRLRASPWDAAGIPETAGHPWWLAWAGDAMSAEVSAREELRQRERAFNRAGGGR